MEDMTPMSEPLESTQIGEYISIVNLDTKDK